MPAPRTAHTRNRPRLILASASARRLALLRQVGIDPDAVVAPEIDETAKRGEKPADLARRLATAKARAAERCTELNGAVVIGADTVVACGRRPLPKAEDEAVARRCLSLLSGRRHRVYGGICVIDAEGQAHQRLVMTQVSFKRLSAAEIDAYLALGEWRGKAGGYAIQGHAALFVRRINGSYTNVVGLPVFETGALLAGLGIVAAAVPEAAEA